MNVRHSSTKIIFRKRQNLTFHFNPQAIVAQKSTDELVFRRFQGEGLNFLKLDLIDLPPPQIFDAHLFETTREG